MLKLGSVALNGVPRIVVVVTDRDQNTVIESSCADILEVRVDVFENESLAYAREQVQRIKLTGVPIILTVRNDVKEGGCRAITDNDKYEIFKAMVSLVDAIDIELASPILAKVVALAREHGKVIIVSSHDLNQTASDEKLEDYFQRSKKGGADIVKIAMKANNKDDVKRLMAFTLKHGEDNVVTMSVGSIGSKSRLMLPAMGSLLTYSYLSKESAPGQIQLFRLQQDLRFYYPDYNEYFIGKHGMLEHA
jgi:3-dehydroquinate dehydratase I